MARHQAGFALPTILIASVVMLTILAASVSAVGSATAALETQYYNQLSREASESGVARAADCLKQSPTGTPQWSELAPLRPNTNCDGSIIAGMSEYINPYANVKTTFRVGLPANGSTNASRVSATGNVYLTRSSDTNSVWRAFTQSVTQDTRYRNSPKIAGGAGWLDTGHIAAITSVDGQVYGFGSNTNGQITDTSSPASVLFPTKYVLPDGAAPVVKVKTSGQGASFFCILNTNGNIYCRGGAGGSGVVTSTTWTRMALPAGVTALDFSIDGYGADALCALGSDGQGYCAGQSAAGSLGNGVAGNNVYALSTPQRFIIPAGRTLTKIVTSSYTTCGITDDKNVYCAGRNDSGQIGGTTTGSYATPIGWAFPLNRKAKDVAITYHTINDQAIVHVLMTDGTIWSTGNYAKGDLGNGLFTGSTGTGRVPTLFNPIGNAGWITGSALTNPISGRCIDNQSNLANNGNKIQLYDCNGSEAQTWVYGEDMQLTNRGTGMCLDDPGNSSTAGAVLQLYQCNGTAAQKFTLATDSSGRQTIKHISSGLCIDATGAGTVNGTVMQLWTCNNNAAQVYNTGGGFRGWTDMIVGTDTFCGLREDSWSGMWCAGTNTWGQLMNYSQPGTFWNPCANVGTTYTVFNVNLPNGVRVDKSKVSDEWRQQFKSLQVIGTDGNVYGSGRDQYGKFGTGVTGDAANDYRVCQTYSNVTNMRASQPGAAGASAIDFDLPVGVTAMDMSTRDEFTTYVLGSDGRVYAAGRNAIGQVGDGTTTDRLRPVEVKIPRQATYY